MKGLLTLTVLLALSLPCWGDIGGHTKKQIFVISATAVGTYATTRTALSFLPIKSPRARVAVYAIGGFADAVALNYISQRMIWAGVQKDHGDMYHAAKDGASLSGVITFVAGSYDIIKLMRDESKVGVKVAGNGFGITIKKDI